MGLRHLIGTLGAGASVTNIEKRFIQSNVVIALASGWLDRMVKRLWCHQRYLNTRCVTVASRFQ